MAISVRDMAMTMTRILFLLLAVTVTERAQALTCMEPDVLSEFAQLHASSESYVVLRGRLSFDSQQLADLVATQGPKEDESLVEGDVPTSAPAPVLARFEGRRLGPYGFAQQVTANITLEVNCSMGCAPVEPGANQLIFALSTEVGYEVTISDCDANIYPSPDRATVRAMTICLRSGDCPPPLPGSAF